MLRRVYRGDKLQITADEFNTHQAAADDYLRRLNASGGQGGPALPGFDGLVLVKNDTAGTIPRFGVLALTGIVIPPGDNLELFQSRPAFTGGLPADDSTKLVIAQAPIPSQAMAMAMIAGMSVVQVNMTDGTHGYAKPTENDPTKLTSSDSGPFRILYAESGTGTKWAAVLFPTAVGGESEARAARVVSGTGATYTCTLVSTGATISVSVDGWTGSGTLFTAGRKLLVWKDGTQWYTSFVPGTFVPAS